MYKVLSGILTDRLYRLAERYGLIDPSQEGFRRLHSTQRQVQSLHWAFEAAAEQKKRLYVVYLDFANAFNSVDHEALWRWLREMNVPDIDLLRSLYHESSYVADLPYGKSAPIPLTRGTKQGDKLSPLLFDLIFNCLLLALRATGIAHRLMTGLRTPARGFADDLVLCTESPEDMSRLLNVVADFCQWSGMRIKLQKSVASAFDFARKEELPTGGILYKGVPLVHLPADASFCYLGVRASILARTAGGRRPPQWRPSASPNLDAEKAHVFSVTKDLIGVAKQHRYLLSQMVPAMDMVASARFRYSAALVPWSDAELDRLYKTWLQLHRAAWRLTPGFPSAPFVLPGEQAGLPVSHPRVALVQALTTHIEQLCALPDDLRLTTIDRYIRLCNRCGCHNERELAEHLQSRGKLLRCPIARLLKACGQLGVQVRLPACLTLGKRVRELSWHGLLGHLRSRALAPDAADQLRADFATVEVSWPDICCRLRRRGVGSPRMLVINPRGPQGVWLLPSTLPRNPGWLEPLRRTLCCANTAILFPLLDRGEGVPDEAVHQALLHDVLHGLRMGDVSVSSLFADGRWDTLRSSATWLSWQLTLQRHGLPVSRDVWATGHERSRGPILDLLLLGGCPDANPAVLRDLCVELAPYLRSARMDQRMEERSPLTWEPVCLHPDAALFALTDSTAGSAAYGPYDTSTRDGLVRVERAGHHVGTVKQSRFGLLSAAYDPEELCQALPAWIAAIEIDEAAKGVPSTEFWAQVQGVLEGDCILGCNPLVAPAAFARAFRNMGSLEGWGHADRSPITRAVYSLLTIPKLEQLHMCRGLTAEGCWYVLTRRSTLAPEMKRHLEARANPCHVFPRGTRAAAAKGSWRTGKMGTTKILENWSLWASLGAAPNQQRRAELKLRLTALHFTVEGVAPSDPLGREVAYGPTGAVYQYDGILVATDGSLKDDGSMGAAFVSMGERIPARSVAVFCSASSTRPELTAIALALEACPATENLTILTDSLDSLTTLFHLRRADFPISLYRNPTRQLYIHIVRLLNRRHAAGVLTRLIKVKAHCGEPLNEAADALASAAAEADGAPMSGELHLDPCAVHFYLNHNAPVEWDSRVRKFLTRESARQAAAKLLEPRSRRDGTDVVPAITTSWLMRQDQGRQVLGASLRAMRTNAAKRRVLQTLAGAFPGNALLYKWKIRTSGACDLCGAPAETQAHIQCVCVALKGARISAHHNLAGMVFSAIAAGGHGWMVYRELTLAGLQGLPVPAAAIAEWSRMWDEMTDRDLETATDADSERALASGIRRKRPDGWAVHWGRRRVLVLRVHSR